MERITPVYNDVNICFACNDCYAQPLMTMIYSLLKNCDRSRRYDIVILHHDISEENRVRLLAFACDGVSVRFVDMSPLHDTVNGYGRSYISAETNYRLFILSEMFSEYERMLYLDCDMQAVGDISQLYDTPLDGMALGACEEASFRVLSLLKKAVFFDGKPCNVDYYRREYLKLKQPQDYFNAGMLLFDLKKCREFTDEKKALELLAAHRMHYNDQDALNLLFESRVKLLDIRWNYSVAIPEAMKSGAAPLMDVCKDLVREDIGIVHYISSRKPWNSDVPLCEIYRQNEQEMNTGGVLL